MEKKKMKLWKKILLIILLLVVIFAIFVLRKYIIITNLINASKDYVGKTNFTVDTYTLSNDTVSLMKIYYKDENFLTTTRTFSHDVLNERNFSAYNKDDETIIIIQSGENKTAVLNANIAPIYVNTISEFDDIKFKIPLKFT